MYVLTLARAARASAGGPHRTCCRAFINSQAISLPLVEAFTLEARSDCRLRRRLSLWLARAATNVRWTFVHMPPCLHNWRASVAARRAQGCVERLGWLSGESHVATCAMKMRSPYANFKQLTSHRLCRHDRLAPSGKVKPFICFRSSDVCTGASMI